MQIRVKITKDKSGAVKSMPLEEYLRGVVPSECYASWPPEALKAQAVAARTYAAHKIKTRGGKTFDADDTTAYQSYNPAKICAATDRAVSDTAGMVLTYNGKPLDTCVYAASNGGETVSSAARWGGFRAYLPAQKDPYDAKTGRKRSGHGVGMSQWGACQMAKEGKDYKEILAFYYPGTEITLREG